jgi:hypothetical protein
MLMMGLMEGWEGLMEGWEGLGGHGCRVENGCGRVKDLIMCVKDPTMGVAQ